MAYWEGSSQTVTTGETEKRQEGDTGREEGSQRGAVNRWKEKNVSAKKKDNVVEIKKYKFETEDAEKEEEIKKKTIQRESSGAEMKSTLFRLVF